jgi:hypothetical protein
MNDFQTIWNAPRNEQVQYKYTINRKYKPFDTTKHTHPKSHRPLCETLSCYGWRHYT